MLRVTFQIKISFIKLTTLSVLSLLCRPEDVSLFSFYDPYQWGGIH